MMANETDTPSTQPPVLAYARLLRQLHELVAQGKGDTEEAEVLADLMDDPWYAMTPKEQARMRGLSVDLHALREGGPTRVGTAPEQLVNWKRALTDAYIQSEAGDTDELLDLLRQPSPSALPKQLVPFFQATCWEKLGDLETALLFMKEADRLDPDQALSVLLLLQRLGRTDELPEYADRVIENPTSPPLELYLAAVALLRPTHGMGDADATPILRRVVDVLNRALREYLALPSRERDECPDADVDIAQVLGISLERLGEVKAAIKVYTETIARHPRAGEMYMARGFALYEQDQRRALADLVAAVHWGVASIWPYLHLARHALQHSAPAEALRLAAAAERQPGPTSARAEVYEIIGMALAELGQPLDRVLENFDWALALDPKNDRIRQNREIAATAAPQLRARRPGRHYLPTSAPLDLQSVRRARGDQINNRWEMYDRQHRSSRSGALGLV